MDGLKL